MTGIRLFTSSWKQILKLSHDPQMRKALASIPIIKRSVQIGGSLARAVLPGPTRRLLDQKVLGGNATGMPDGTAQVSPVRALSQAEVGMFTTFDQVTFRIEKARRILGYEPGINFDEGMRRTAAWIQWARL
jgi:hypothetical protein